ncbi:MAG: cytochrome c biogenesis protein DipZ [Alphaproteobacteria bacterium]|nr:cytochrome c biogenesis protein DipZ [Alphaproteobacteria bacterium]
MNIVETGLAFLEGVALIASPCILPVLPLVLSASVEGGKKRPFGIITGFVLSFSAFALFARFLVARLHLDLDIIRNASLVLLLLFGIVMISSTLSEKFSQWTQGAASLGSALSRRGGEGFASGIVIGALIGLVWTPCAGPILAAVLVQVIRQQTDAAGVLMIISFALGAGVPMLIIALLGKKVMDRIGFFKTHAQAVRKAFGGLILLSVAFIASGANPQALIGGGGPAPAGPAQGLQDGLREPYPAPDFSGIDDWINTKPLTMHELNGKVVLVDFWTYSCVNCVRTLPYLTAWDSKYRNKGLVIVGVHAPEFEFEKKPDNVKMAVIQRGIHYPVALDSELRTWDNFHNRYWPAHYLIDRNGNVVYTHFGEGNYEETEHNIRYLLGLTETEPAGAPAVTVEPSSGNGQTPETYLGYRRAERFSSKINAVHDAQTEYQFPSFLPIDQWALKGRWKIGPEYIVSGAQGAALRLNFKARKVFLVLGSAGGGPVHASLMLNGEKVAGNAGKDAPGGTVTVRQHTLYELIDQKTAQNGLLEITADADGLEAYAFTFGD